MVGARVNWGRNPRTYSPDAGGTGELRDESPHLFSCCWGTGELREESPHLFPCWWEHGWTEGWIPALIALVLETRVNWGMNPRTYSAADGGTGELRVASTHLFLCCWGAHLNWGVNPRPYSPVAEGAGELADETQHLFSCCWGHGCIGGWNPALIPLLLGGTGELRDGSPHLFLCCWGTGELRDGSPYWLHSPLREWIGWVNFCSHFSATITIFC